MCVYLFCIFQIVFLNCDRYVEFHAQVCNLKLHHFIVNIFLQHTVYTISKGEHLNCLESMACQWLSKFYNFLCISMAVIIEQGFQSLAEILSTIIRHVIYTWLEKGIGLIWY
jgi:hypothetical protein